MVSFVQGLGIDIDFVEGNGLEDLSVDSLYQLEDPHAQPEAQHAPKFVLGFKDSETIDFTAASLSDCLRWMKSISIVRTNINYVQYLPFLEEIELAGY